VLAAKKDSLPIPTYLLGKCIFAFCNQVFL
jgi:hypothetical protein